MNKLLLFLSSYIPLYFLLIGKNFFERINSIKNFNLFKFNYKKIIFFNNLNDYIFITLILLSIFLFVWLKFFVREGTNKNSFTILTFSNESDKYYYNYISVYFLPSIGLSINNMQDVFVLVAMMVIIGYVYISNDLVYINPVMGFMGYKLYTMELKSLIGDNIETKYIICNKKIVQEIRKGQIIKITTSKKYALLTKIEE